MGRRGGEGYRPERTKMGGGGEGGVEGRGCGEPLLAASTAPGPWKRPLVFGFRAVAKPTARVPVLVLVLGPRGLATPQA